MMSAMSGLPISALVYGWSLRSTWLLLTGTSSSPALTSVATVTCAKAGCAASSAPTAAAQSANRFKLLAAIIPHLHLVALGSAIPCDLFSIVGRSGLHAHRAHAASRTRS